MGFRPRDERVCRYGVVVTHDLAKVKLGVRFPVSTPVMNGFYGTSAITYIKQYLEWRFDSSNDVGS